MLNHQEKEEIYRLLQKGIPVSQVSRQTGRSITTVYRCQNAGKKAVQTDASPGKKKVDSSIEQLLKSRLRDGVTNASKLYRELVHQGYSISYGTVNRYFKDLKNLIYKHRSDIPSIHIETGPGDQAQVDWGSFGKIEVNGRMERLYCFVYVLSYSRAAYIEFTIRQDTQTLKNCHLHAFARLGIPKNIMYDNMKTVVLRRERLPNGNSIPHFNPEFSSFAQHYQFQLQACAPYWPRSKGKVEACVKHVRNDFMQGMRFGKDFFSLEELNEEARRWVDTVANVRVHGGTGEKPIELWKKERQFLSRFKDFPLYESPPMVRRNSTKDGFIQYKSNLYSIPTEYRRRKLLIKETNTSGILTIDIYHEDEIVANHQISLGKGKWVMKDEHSLARSIPKGKRRNYDNNGKNRRMPFVAQRPLSYYDNLLGLKDE